MRILLLPIGIISIILGVIFNIPSEYYPDSQGWNRKVLQGDQFEPLFPLTHGDDLYLVSPNEEGEFKNNGPSSPDSAFIEFRDNAQINVQSKENEKVFNVVAARRTFYAHKAFDETPVFKAWSEQLLPEEFDGYKKALEVEIESFASVAEIENGFYENHEYYVYLRKDLSTAGLEGKNSIGGAYVFFPETHTVFFMYLFNTSGTSTSYLISKSEITNYIHKIIDFAAK